MNNQRVLWLQDARFGLFIHWGLYSVLAGDWKDKRMEYLGEWIMSKFRIPNAEYSQLAKQFNPQRFDADEWVSLAKAAGMRYLVFTAKHHEGFAMYHSKCDPYNIVEASPFGRDPLKELAEACQRQGLTLGLYYSQDLDWHEPNGGDAGPDVVDNFGMSWGNTWDFPDYSAKNYAQYFNDKVKPQVRELLTNYGPIGLIWFDCPFTITPAQSDELWQLVHELQPDCLVNTRIGNGRGDYGSMGDNQVPDGHVHGTWETPATLNDTWGYKTFDHNWKSAPDTLGVLAGLASKNVNYLLNIGPQPNGQFPPASVDILREISEWMAVNQEAIHGTRQSPYPYDFEWGGITQRAATDTQPARLYLMFRQWPTSTFTLNGMHSRVCSATSLSDGQSVSFQQAGDTLTLHLPDQKPASAIPVIALEIEGTPSVDQRLIEQQGVIRLPAQCASVHGESGKPPAADETGILQNWLDARDWVDWEVHFPAAGDYAVEVVTSAVHHSRTWLGGHSVQIQAPDGSLQATLNADVMDTRYETRCYAQAISRCGTLHITRAGDQRLALRPTQIQSNQGVGLALVAIKLRPLLSN